jgi:hypothetical protein
MLTASDIIDRLGTQAKIARFCGCVPSHVSMWRKKGIPREQALALWAIAKARGHDDITLERILRAAPVRRRQKKKPAVAGKQSENKGMPPGGSANMNRPGGAASTGSV